MKKCLVTCVTSEVGEAIALHLSDKYPELFITGRNSDKLSTIANKIAASNKTKVTKLALDFQDKQTIQNVTESIKGRIDAIVLVLPKIPARETSRKFDEEWERLFKIIFVRPVLLLESLVPALKQSERAKVALISGITSRQYLGNYSINGPIRAAWVAQMKAMSQEYGKYGIHFNTLSFGGILTPSFRAKIKKEADEEGKNIEDVLYPRYENVPLRKYATLDDVCYAVDGMLSAASDHMTGQNIICDGGFIRCY